MRSLRSAALVPLALSAFALLAPRLSPAAPEPGRLGRDAVPTFESVRLTLDARTKEYTGSAHIDLELKASTNEIRFHAREMKLDKVALASKRETILPTIEMGEDGIVIATSPRALAPGKYSLDIEFSNDFDSHAASLYRLETGGESYAFTQFEADDARGAFPCWDEPEFKIPYQLTLRVPAAHMAVTNTPPERERAEGEWKTVVFRRTKPLPSYLIAIATGPLEWVPIPGLSVPGRVVTVRGSTTLTGVAASMAPPILRALERYFGGRYPYEKLDLIAVPEFWPGAMENPGAVTFADRILLLDDRTASVGEKSTLAKVLAHELAHMWFGDVVTMKWWDDLWLNESFAEWMGDKVAHEVYPEFRINIGQGTELQRAFHEDARLSTRAIRQPVTAIENLAQLADALAYQKGEAVLGMFEAWIGPDTFRKGVLDYIAAHRWGNAVAADLWKALSKASGVDVGGALDTFLEQGGVPLVSAEILPGGRVRLAQRRFVNFGNVAPPGLRWKIPVALKYSDGASTRVERVLLSDSVTVISLPGGRPPAWLHPNAGEMGYYRWQVSPGELDGLARQAVRVLDVRERVGFLANAGGLLDAGSLEADEYLRLLGHFAGDPAPEVVEIACAALQEGRLAFVTPELEAPFARYVRATLRPALDRFGRARREGEDPVVSKLRPDLLHLLGDAGSDEQVLDYADSLARRYLADPLSIDPSLSRTALELYAQRGDRARFDDLRARFEGAKTAGERDRFLGALGCFRDPALVDAALAYALTGPLRPQEVLTIPGRVARSPAYRHHPFRWLTANYDAIVAKIPKMYRIFLVYFAEGCSAAILDEAKTFFQDRLASAPGMDKELAKVIDDTNDCVALSAREQARVAAYLSQLSGGQ